MNYIDIILLVVVTLIIISGLVFGIKSQFLFPILSGIFGATILGNMILDYLKANSQGIIIGVYALTAVFIGGLAALVFKILTLFAHLKVVSRVLGLIIAIVSVELLFLSLRASITVFSSAIDSEIVKAFNESLLLGYFK